MGRTNTAPLRTKLIFWLFLGFLSVAIAEVSVASAPFAFINPIETVFLTLFYGSHLLVFAWWAFRRGWPTFSTLWFAGVLFGLYEFYITKVLWAPPWGDTISLAHVDVVAFVVLALFWHPFTAFMFPLAIGEAVGTTSRRIGPLLPRWLTGASIRRVAIGAVLAAVTHGLLTASPSVAFISTTSAVAAVTVVGVWWRRGDRHLRWNLRELLPTDRQGKGIALVLALQYIAFIPLWNPDSIPPLLGHVVVWLLYAGFVLLLRASLQESDPTPPGAWAPVSCWPRRRTIKWVGLLVVVTTIAGAGPPGVGALAVWIVAIVAGLRTMTGTFRRALHPPATAVPPPASHASSPVHR